MGNKSLTTAISPASSFLPLIREMAICILQCILHSIAKQFFVSKQFGRFILHTTCFRRDFTIKMQKNFKTRIGPIFCLKRHFCLRENTNFTERKSIKIQYARANSTITSFAITLIKENILKLKNLLKTQLSSIKTTL